MPESLPSREGAPAGALLELVLSREHTSGSGGIPYSRPERRATGTSGRNSAWANSS